MHLLPGRTECSDDAPGRRPTLETLYTHEERDIDLWAAAEEEVKHARACVCLKELSLPCSGGREHPRSSGAIPWDLFPNGTGKLIVVI